MASWASSHRLARVLKSAAVLLFGFTAVPGVNAQIPGGTGTLDSGGNSLLSGTYYFRELAYLPSSQATLREAVAAYGNITFDGNGNYTVSAMLNDSSQPGPYSFSTKGTYTISANGYGYLTHPLSATDRLYGVAAQLSPFQPAVFMGSATETSNHFSDLFIAAPVSSFQLTSIDLLGTYNMVYLNFPLTNTSPNSFDPHYAYDAIFQMTPNGMGQIGTVNVAGNEGPSGTFNESENGITYAFNNNAAIVTFPSAPTVPGEPFQVSVPIPGQEYLYLSPDGNFVFGGSPNIWDMLVGVRYAGNANFGGLYYDAGILYDLSQLNATPSVASLESWYGAFAAANSLIVGDERILSSTATRAYHSTYTGSYALNSNGTSSDSTMQYITGAGGTIRVGYGTGHHIGARVSLQSPVFSGSGVYLNPTGLVNAASFAPFTSGIAPGEFIVLSGSNLSTGPPQTGSSASPATSLNGVQVTIGGQMAQVYYVSSTEILAIVPPSIEGPFAQVQVSNNGQSSNTISAGVNLTDAAVFLEPAGGTLYGAILHQNSASLVTAASPANVGEIVSIFATGLGQVAAGVTTNAITASIGGVQATVTYSGVAPGIAGVYQLNIQVPSGVTPGNAVLDIVGPDSATSEAVIPVSGSN